MMECHGQKTCSFDVNDFIYAHYEKVPTTCFNDYARFYVQVYCQHSEEDLEERQSWQTLIVWLTIAQALVYWLSLEYLQLRSEADVTEYDKATTTISDYTVQFQINEDLYDNFKDRKWPYLNRFL